MKYIVYKTINKINKKFYIGVHKTENPNIFDGYLGCGIFDKDIKNIKNPNTHLLRAFLKYGKDNFYRITLKEFNNYQDALDLERWLVTEEFIKDNLNYNSTVGGGLPPKNTIKIYQFNLNGNFISEWESASSIRRFFDSHIQMNDIISNKRSFAGYLWSYNPKINIEEYKLHTKGGFITQYDENLNFIKKFSSAKEASIELKISLNKITMSIFRKTKINNFYFLKSDFNIKEIFNKQIEYVYRQTKIFLYDNTGNFNKVFKSINECIKYFNISCDKLKNIIKNKKLYNNMYFSYKYSDNYFNIDHPENKVIIHVLQFDKNNNFICKWENIDLLLKQYPEALKSCRGNIKSYKNYIFKYEIN